MEQRGILRADETKDNRRRVARLEAGTREISPNDLTMPSEKRQEKCLQLLFILAILLANELEARFDSAWRLAAQPVSKSQRLSLVTLCASSYRIAFSCAAVQQSRYGAAICRLPYESAVSAATPVRHDGCADSPCRYQRNNAARRVNHLPGYKVKMSIVVAACDGPFARRSECPDCPSSWRS